MTNVLVLFRSGKVHNWCVHCASIRISLNIFSSFFSLYHKQHARYSLSQLFACCDMVIELAEVASLFSHLSTPILGKLWGLFCAWPICFYHGVIRTFRPSRNWLVPVWGEIIDCCALIYLYHGLCQGLWFLRSVLQCIDGVWLIG